MSDASSPLLQVRRTGQALSAARRVDRPLPREGARCIRAVDGVDLTIREGETLALVGEVGCGKSTTGRCILYLQDPTGGRCSFAGRRSIPPTPPRCVSGASNCKSSFRIPNSSLNPRMTVGQTLEEALAFHKIVPKSERANRARELLETVGPERPVSESVCQ